MRSARNGWVRCFRSRPIPRGNCVDPGRSRKPHVETRSESNRPRDPKRCERPSSPCGVRGKRLGVVGFSMGGVWGLWLAEELPADVAAVVLFYGTGDGN